jgi:hypothetical protein
MRPSLMLSLSREVKSWMLLLILVTCRSKSTWWACEVWNKSKTNQG